MPFDSESGLFLGHLSGQQSARDINVDQLSTDGAVDVVMTIGAAVKTACLIAERKLQDDPVLG